MIKKRTKRIYFSTDERIKDGGFFEEIDIDGDPLEEEVKPRKCKVVYKRSVDGKVIIGDDADNDFLVTYDSGIYYVELEKKIVLMKGDCLSTYEFYESIDTVIDGFDITNYRKICIDSTASLDYMIFVINNNLDYKIMNIYIAQIIDKLNLEIDTYGTYFKRMYKKDEQIILSFGRYSKDIEYCFDEETYKELYSKYNDILQYSSDYLFNFKAASNLYKSSSQNLNEKVAMAIVSTEIDSYCYWIPDFNRDKYSIGDEVFVSTLNLWYESGTIKKLFFVEKIFNPINMEYVSNIIWGYQKDFWPIFVFKHNNYKKLDNKELLEIFKKYVQGIETITFRDKTNCNVIIQETNNEIDEFDYTETTKWDCSAFYINAYTNSSYLKKDINDNYLININDLIIHCQSNRNLLVYGIVINPGVDDLYIDLKYTSVAFMKKCIINDRKTLSGIIDLLNNNEIDYIGDMEYELLRTYLKYDMSVEDLALKENSSEEVVQAIINKSIDKLSDIYIYNYSKKSNNWRKSKNLITLD